MLSKLVRVLLLIVAAAIAFGVITVGTSALDRLVLRQAPDAPAQDAEMTRDLPEPPPRTYDGIWNFESD